MIRRSIRAACVLAFAAVLLAGAAGPAGATVGVRLQKFKQNGSTVLTRSFTGFSVSGVAVDAPGHVFIACSDNKIRKYTDTGVYLSYIGLNDVQDVAIDPAGNIWACTGTQIWEFNMYGAQVRHWNASAEALVVDPDYYVWYTDFFFVYRRNVYGAGTAQAQVRPMHMPGAEWASVVDLAETGGLAWYGFYGPDLSNVGGYPSTTFGTATLPSRSFDTSSYPVGIAHDGLGYLYTAAVDGKVYKYQWSGSRVFSFATGRTIAFDTTTYVRLAGIGVDHHGYIWIAAP